MEQLDTTELDALRQEIRSALETVAPPAGWRDEYAEWSPAKREAFDDRHRTALREPGCLAAHWPKELGGRDLSAPEDIGLKLELQRVDHPPVGRGIAFHDAAATPARHGSREQQERRPGILAGRAVVPGLLRARCGVRPRLPGHPRSSTATTTPGGSDGTSAPGEDMSIMNMDENEAALVSMLELLVSETRRIPWGHGRAEIQRNIIAERVPGLPREKALN